MKLKAIAATTAMTLAACSPKEAQQPVQAASEALIEQSVKAMKPAEDAANKAIREIVETQQRKADEVRAKLQAEREAAKPKAYRWKDKAGTWHLSDVAPESPEAVEIIPLT